MFAFTSHSWNNNVHVWYAHEVEETSVRWSVIAIFLVLCTNFSLEIIRERYDDNNNNNDEDGTTCKRHDGVFNERDESITKFHVVVESELFAECAAKRCNC